MSRTALVVIDMINAYDFPDAEKVASSAEQAVPACIRRFEVRVPPDAVAHIYENLADAALTMMERNMKADLTPVRG